MDVLDFAESFALRYRAYKGGAWCYEDGCLYRALVLLHQTTGQARWLDLLIRLTDPQIAPDGTLFGYHPTEYNIDNILAGRCLFHLSQETGDPRYFKAAHRLADQLRHHPRTSTGNYWHKQIYPNQVWLDGLYMGLPFQIEWGVATGDSGLVRDGVLQFKTALELTRRPDGLYAHACDVSRKMPWCDPVTGHSHTLWSRSLGWLAMALVDSLQLLPDDLSGELAPSAAAFLKSAARYQTDTGRWWQITDRPHLPGNYLESSATAMFAYAFQVAERLGLCPGAKDIGIRALNALSDTALSPDSDGVVRLHDICAVAGLGGANVLRDGTPTYYLSEPVVADDVKGVGPFLMAVAESLRSA